MCILVCSPCSSSSFFGVNCIATIQTTQTRVYTYVCLASNRFEMLLTVFNWMNRREGEKISDTDICGCVYVCLPLFVLVKYALLCFSIAVIGMWIPYMHKHWLTHTNAFERNFGLKCAEQQRNTSILVYKLTGISASFRHTNTHTRTARHTNVSTVVKRLPVYRRRPHTGRKRLHFDTAIQYKFEWLINMTQGTQILACKYMLRVVT